jgi:probable phosphoglycerate mutase
MDDFHVAHGATELIFVRHGDALQHDPAEPLTPDDIDPPLSLRGTRQAKALAQRLERREITALYASPLQRCAQTAEPLADALGVGIAIDARLREVELAGVGSVGMQELAQIAISRGGWSHLEGTEPSAQIRGRMCDAAAAIVAAHPGERVAVFSHAGAINAYFAHLLGLGADFFFPTGNTSLNIVRARGDRRLIVTINDIAHLEYLK